MIWIWIRGSMLLTNCPDPDADPDPAIFIIDLQDANKKLVEKKFFCLLLFEGTFTSFVKDKKSNRSHKSEVTEVSFSYYFCLVIEGSGSGSIPLTNGSGSGSRRPHNIQIRRIRIRIRIRIRNTGLNYHKRGSGGSDDWEACLLPLELSFQRRWCLCPGLAQINPKDICEFDIIL